MKAITHQELAQGFYTGQTSYATHKSLWSQFIEFADNQEYNRLGWLVLGIFGHGTIFTIATLALVTVLGNNFALYITTCCAMVMVVSVNLAAMPTKYTIPIFFFSLAIDLAVIIAAVLLH